MTTTTDVLEVRVTGAMADRLVERASRFGLMSVKLDESVELMGSRIAMKFWINNGWCGYTTRWAIENGYPAAKMLVMNGEVVQY